VCKIENLKKRVLILHGWQGSAKPHWQTYLYDELLENNYDVSFPSLPNKDMPTLDSWIFALEYEMTTFRPHIVVCHSLANILWFHYINQNKMTYNLEKLMLVSPVSPLCSIQEIKTFFPYQIPNDLCATNKIMAASDNDPYISIDELYALSNVLNIGLKVLEGAGHINADSGYGKLSCAYDWIIS
jgi:predicted alpha/beta hydrolase family esterase